MPIPAGTTIDELMAELMKQPDKAAVATALHAQAQPIFQLVFDKGHSTATKQNESQVGSLNTQITGLRGELVEKDRRIAELAAKAPEIATMQATHKKEVDDLAAKHKGELEKRDAVIESERINAAVRKVRDKLVEKHKVDPDYADVLLAKPEMRQRFKHDANKAEVSIVRATGDSPYAPSEKQTVHELFADELLPNVPKKFVGVKGDTGSNAKPGSGAAAGETDYDKIREQTKASQGKEKPPTAASRLGVGGATK